MGQRREIQSACTTRADRFDVRLALALFCLLTCLYWLTASAHTYIADGETVYLQSKRAMHPVPWPVRLMVICMPLPGLYNRC